MTIKSFTFSSVPLVAAGLVLASGCMRAPTEKPVYKEARRAIEALDTLPQKAKIQPIAKSKLYIGKSAARADLLVIHDNADGQKVETWYAVHLKRVARTWVAQDASVRPDATTYANVSSSSDPLTP